MRAEYSALGPPDELALEGARLAAGEFDRDLVVVERGDAAAAVLRHAHGVALVQLDGLLLRRGPHGGGRRRRVRAVPCQAEPLSERVPAVVAVAARLPPEGLAEVFVQELPAALGALAVEHQAFELLAVALAAGGGGGGRALDLLGRHVGAGEPEPHA